ncbi:MAG: glycerol kinase [Proteobacteria bacterium]|nr:glycerol kinase [Pseudomonadota bacterium]
MSDSFILALDQGTTGSTAMIFDASLAVRGRGYREVPQHFPQSGWVEHDPEDIFSTAIEAGRAAVAEAGISPTEIAAIGITNQRETTLLWDRATGQPVSRAVVWQCRRSAAICEQWRRVGLAPIIREHTGLEVDAYFSASKVRWLLDHIDGLEARVAVGDIAFGTVDSWLLWRLTNGKTHATDVTNASRTMFYDIRANTWDDDLLAAFDINRRLLGEVLPSSAMFGTAEPEHFGARIPIMGVAGDQQAALFGQACATPGSAKNTYGTGCFLVMNTGQRAVTSSSRLLTTVGWKLADAPVQYALEGSVFSAGSAVQWLRDGLGLIRRAPDIEPLATSVTDNGGVYLVPAFTGLGAPHWDMYARGAIVGITRDTRAAHIARATLESVAYQTRDLIEAMRADAGHALERLRVDGGMTGNDFLMQFQADVLGIPVERPVVVESTAMGAACLAALGVGMFSSTDEIARRIRIDRVFEPAMSVDARDTLHAAWQRAVERSRAWAAQDPTPAGG